MKKTIKIFFILISILILALIFKEKYPILLKKIIYTQRKLIPLISKNFKNKDNHLTAFFLLFLYGFIHSIGPGHGKFIISSSTLIDKLNIKKIIMLSAIIAYLQGFSALFFYHFFLLIKKQISPHLSFSLENNFQKISAFLIILLIIFIIFKEIKKRKFSLNKVNNKNVYVFAILLGLIPCGGILNILIFLKLLNLDKYNFISTISICSGMFATLFLSGVLSTNITTRFKNILNLKYIYYLKYLGFIFIIIYIFTNFIIY